MVRLFWVLNSACGIGNLAFYAWGSHDPASLAIGIFNLFIVVLCEFEIRLPVVRQ